MDLPLTLLGFAVLNTVDVGYYGKGIYFTSNAMYGLQYAKPSEPVLLICWILPGNVYPVIERHDAPPGKTLMGYAEVYGLFGSFHLGRH